jgi:hypothetical protein
MRELQLVVTEYAMARVALAIGYQAAGEQGLGIALFQEALADSERVLGADDPVTAWVRSYLTAVRR